MAFIVDITGNPGNRNYRGTGVIGGWLPDTIPLKQDSQVYDTAGICIWESEFTIGSGPYAGEKVVVGHGPNACTSKTFTLGTINEFGGRPNVIKGKNGQLAVWMQ